MSDEIHSEHSEDKYRHSFSEVRAARDQAEFLRDQLLAEYERLVEHDDKMPQEFLTDSRHQKGREAMRKAIAAADQAIASIDQALRQIERVTEDDPPAE